eukprot:COSAG06_NODE_39412_length_413_cov_0.611465_2_plen_88_part_00
MILPRQARGTRKENSRKKRRFIQNHRGQTREMTSDEQDWRQQQLAGGGGGGGSRTEAGAEDEDEVKTRKPQNFRASCAFGLVFSKLG